MVINNNNGSSNDIIILMVIVEMIIILMVMMMTVAMTIMMMMIVKMMMMMMMLKSNFLLFSFVSISSSFNANSAFPFQLYVGNLYNITINEVISLYEPNHNLAPNNGYSVHLFRNFLIK